MTVQRVVHFQQGPVLLLAPRKRHTALTAPSAPVKARSPLSTAPVSPPPQKRALAAPMCDASWREAALARLFQHMSSAHLARPSPPYDPSLSVADVAGRRLLAVPAHLAALAALAPHAADAALALLDQALRDLPRAALFDDAAVPCAHPRLLGRAVRVVFAESDGRSLVRVRSSSRGSGESRHLVLIGGVKRTGGNGDPACGERLLSIDTCAEDDANDGMPYFYCSCPAFEYKYSGEFICKHIVAAGMAIACNLADSSTVSDDDFIELLSEPT